MIHENGRFSQATPDTDAKLMTTKLNGPLRREFEIGGSPYVLTIDPQKLKLVPKGKRKGYELDWESLVNGDAALATALTATLAAAPEPATNAPKTRKASRPRLR